MLQQFITFFHLILAITLIGLVLVQHGKGADAGAAFGGGSSNTVFGSAGSGNFLTHLTTAIALLLAITSISLTLLANRGSKAEALSDQILSEEYSPPIPVPGDEAKPSQTPEVPN